MIKQFLLIFVLILQLLIASAHPDCKNLDNGQPSDNPIFKEPSCSSECFICQTKICENFEGSECPVSACSKQGTESFIKLQKKYDKYIFMIKTRRV